MYLIIASLKKTVAVVSAAVLLSSCITSRNETVIERSAPSRPAWTNGDYADEGREVVFLNYMRGDVFRLELGLKQAQVGAVRETKNLLIDRSKQELLAKDEKFFKAGRGAIELGIESACSAIRASKYMPTEGVPRTVYWEQISEPTSEGTKTYFNIYVLLTVSREQLNDAMLKVLLQMQHQSGASQEFANAVINDSRQ